MVIEVEDHKKKPETISDGLRHAMESHAQMLKELFESKGIKVDVHCHLLDDGALGIAFIDEEVLDHQRSDFLGMLDMTSGIVQSLGNAQLEARGYPPKLKVMVTHDCSFERKEVARGDGS